MKRLVAFSLLVLPRLALADLPPPEGYVEQCTVEKQCKATEECRTCSANYSERDRCEKQLGKEGFTKRCQARGGSVWTEIWARPKPKK